MVAAINLLVEVGNKLTVEQLLKVQTPHQMQGVLVIKGHHGLTGGYLIKYQALLLDFSELILKTCHTLNLATLMPVENPELTHSCLQTLGKVYAHRSDLTDPGHRKS